MKVKLGKEGRGMETRPSNWNFWLLHWTGNCRSRTLRVLPDSLYEIPRAKYSTGSTSMLSVDGRR